MSTEIRPYDPERDREDALRIWWEVGWLRKEEGERLDRYVANSRALVGTVEGQAECLVVTAPGTLRHQDEDLPFAGVMGVTTSHVARRQGLAKRTTALAVAAEAAEGALVAGLGMFDQGFYDTLGFGSGGYDHWLFLDPADLRVPVRARVPRRLTADDWEAAHAARLRRRRRHGAVCFISPEVTRHDMEGEKRFGFGYYDGPGGTLSHHVWLCADEMERGPYHVLWMAFETREQFLELMALLAGLGDQVRLLRMPDLPGIQLQDLLASPFHGRQITEKGRFAQRMGSAACWQMRICDLAGCLERTRLPTGEVRFQLRLTDPIERLLEEKAPWRGVGGDYIVALGAESWAERGRDDSLPVLEASAGAFTRLWLGVRPATGLAFTDSLAGPPELLEVLDGILRLPNPKPDWEF